MELSDLVEEALSPRDAFLRGQALRVSDNDLRRKISEFIEHGETFTDSHRFLLYGSLTGLQDQPTLLGSIRDFVENLLDLNEDEVDRRNVIAFLLAYTAKVLPAQHPFPTEYFDSMQFVDFQSPLIKQLGYGKWQIDHSRLKLPLELYSNIDDIFEASKVFLYGETSAYDRGIEPLCAVTKMVGVDVGTLIEQPGFLEELEFSNYVTFVWSAYWYPKFLLLAYANASNIFMEPIDTNQEVQWCTGWEDSIGIAPSIPRGMALILRFTPRILTLMATAQISEYFDEIPDNFVNLFPALKHTRPEADATLTNAVVRQYLDRAIDDDDQGLDLFLDEDQDMTLFFEIISACLYTKNVKLIEELAKLDDEITKKCVFLNPETPDSVLDMLSPIEFELSEGIMFNSGYFEDDKCSQVDSFAEFMAAVANNTKDFEFANSIKLRWTRASLQPKVPERET